jgi:cytochrome c556
MKKITLFISAFLLVCSFVTAASAADPVLKALKSRQGLMTLYSFNIGQLGAMAGGKIPYNAKQAQTAADNLFTLASLKGGAMWPKGSGNDNPALAGKTRAKPEIWSTYPKVAEASKNLVMAATAMAAAAGTGLDGVRANIKKLGGACGGCHKPFRAKKKK